MRLHLSRLISVLALLCVMLYAGSRPAMARPPSQVELRGEFEIVRESDDPCQISVPTKIKGTLTLNIDFVEGTAEGSLQGSGSGSDVVPPGLPKESPCSGEDGTDVYRAETSFSGVISRDAHDVLTNSDLVGRVDGTTGEFVVYAIIEIEGSGSHGAPGSTYYCAGSSGPQSECPIGEIVSPQPATITGRVVTGEVPTLAIDWYTNYCGRVEGDTIRWGRTGCPTSGSSTPGIVSFVAAPNSSPVIRSLTLDNPEPYTGDIVAVSVDATDPDGDPLTYSWTVTDLVESDGSTATWRPETAQTYTIVVRVEDDIGGTTEESTTVTVIDPAPVTTAEPVEESVAVVPSEDAGQIDVRPDDDVAASEDADQTDVRPDEPSGVDSPDTAAGVPAEDTGGNGDSGIRIPLPILILLLGVLFGAAGIAVALKLGMLGGKAGSSVTVSGPVADEELRNVVELVKQRVESSWDDVPVVPVVPVTPASASSPAPASAPAPASPPVPASAPPAGPGAALGKELVGSILNLPTTPWAPRYRKPDGTLVVVPPEPGCTWKRADRRIRAVQAPGLRPTLVLRETYEQGHWYQSLSHPGDPDHEWIMLPDGSAAMAVRE